MNSGKLPTTQETLYLQIHEAERPDDSKRLRFAAIFAGGMALYSLRKRHFAIAAISGGAAGLLAAWGSEPNNPSVPPTAEQASAALGALG